MNRIILIISLYVVGIGMIGCSKNDPKPETNADYFFRFKVDGRLIDYPFSNNQINLTGTLGYDNNTEVHTVHIGGIKNILGGTTNTLTFLMSDSSGISTGINYCNIPGEGDTYPDFMFTMGYYDEEGKLYIASGVGDSYLFDLYEPAFIKFTAITDDFISGSFSGKLVRYESSNGTNVLLGSVVLTEGEFKVPRY